MKSYTIGEVFGRDKNLNMSLLFLKILFFLLSMFSLGLSFNSSVCSDDVFIEVQFNETVNLTSPGFESSHYASDSLCSWTLANTDFGRKLQVIFLTVSIWPSFNCIFDGLILFDGDSISAPVLGKYCTGTPTYSLMTSGPNLHVVFYSSDVPRRPFKGFAITVKNVESEPQCKIHEIKCHNKECVPDVVQCDNVDDCGDGTDEETCNISTDMTTTCGETPISPSLIEEDRIVGGVAAIAGSWPWQCSLRRSIYYTDTHLCGAVLINNLWVVTAAHCFRDTREESLWSIFCGIYYKDVDTAMSQQRYIKNLYIHPLFDKISQNLNSRDGDIALIRVNAPFTITTYVRPVCLPPWISEVEKGFLCYITGWGETLGTGNPNVLNQATVPIVSQEQCQANYPSVPITDNVLCAGYSKGGKDSCKGDSGGPLVLKSGPIWFLVGIVSGGGGCAAENQPGIYTKVSSFTPWIEEIMHQK